MIRRLNLFANRQLVSNLSFEGKVLSFKSDSPLVALYDASVPKGLVIDESNTPNGVSTNKQFDDFEQAYFNYNNVGSDDLVTPNHTVLMDSMRDILSELLGNTIRMSTTVVNPICVDIYTKVQSAALDASSLNKEIEGWQVLALPKIYTNYNLLELLKRSAKTERINFSGLSELLFKGISIADYSEVCTTGLSDIDGPVKNLFKDEVSFYNGDVWDLIEAKTQMGELFFSKELLMTYLFLTGVKNGRHPSLDSDDLTLPMLNSIRSMINGLAEVLLAHIGVAVSKYETSMVLFPKGMNSRWLDSDVTYVNSSMFRKWIKEDGNNEEIFAEYLYRKNKGVSTRLEDTEVLSAAWKARSKLTAIRADSTRVVTSRALIRKCVFETINKVVDLEDRVEAREKAEKFLSDVPFVGSTDVADYIRRAVCIIFIDESADVYDVLTVMNEKMAKDDKLTPQTTALASCIRILARWSCKQLVVEEAAD